MRQPTDLCLLCKVAIADKTNSHIMPRFLSTKFLEAPGKARRGYYIGEEFAKGEKPKVIQDSPKENHILCTPCEHYLSIIEGLAASTFKDWQTHLANGIFKKNLLFQMKFLLSNVVYQTLNTHAS